MSRLSDYWLTRARAAIGIAPCDTVLMAESDCPIFRGRRICVGAVVDGRANRPGLILQALTSDHDSDEQELGVTSAEQARTIIEALYIAWPELRPKAGP